MTEKNEGGLSPAEEAYFETAGEAPLAETTETTTETAEKAAETPEAGKADEAEASAQKERDEKGRFVPLGALHAEREEHKKTKSEVEELKRFRATMEERFRLADEAKKAEEKPDDPFADAPDPDSDPMGWIKWRQERDKVEYAERQKQSQEQRAAAEHANTIRQHQDYVQEHYNEAVKADPAVDEAFKAAWGSYEQELKFLGYRGDQLKQGMSQVFVNFTLAASQAVQNGQPLGDFVKGIAQTRGWQPKAAEQKPAESQELTLPEQLGKVAQAQEASRTIGQAQGRAGTEELGLKEIVDMPPKEFGAWYAVPANKARFDRLMGG